LWYIQKHIKEGKKVDKDYSLLEVKAITPHDLKVEKAEKWRIHVLVDV